MEDEEIEAVEEQEEIEDEFQDGDLDDVEGEPVPQSDESQEPEPESPAPVAPSAYDADPDMQLLQETLGPEAVAAMGRLMARSSEAASLASIHMTSAAAENPELFRVYGAKIHQAVSRLDPALRVRPEAVNVAVATLLVEEANTKGLSATLARLATMAGKGAVPAKKSEPKVIPPEQRPPSPGGSRQAAAPPAKGREGRIQYYMQEFRVNREEAEDLIRSGRA